MENRRIFLVFLGSLFFGEILLILHQKNELSGLLQARIISEKIVQINVARLSKRQHSQDDTSVNVAQNITEDDGTSFLKRQKLIGRSSSELGNISPEIARLAKAASIVRSSAELKQLNRLQQSQSLQIRFGPLLKRIDLDPSKREKLLQLLDGKQNVRQDVAEALQVGRLPRDTPLDVKLQYTREAIAAESSNLDAEIENLVGPDNYDLIKGYEKDVSQFLLVEQLQQALVGAGATLSTAQISGVQKALIANRNPEAEKGNSLIVIPADSRSASMGKDGMSYIQLPPNGVYISPAGSIFSAAILSKRAYAEAIALLDENQAEVLSKIAEQLKSARDLSAGYQ